MTLYPPNVWESALVLDAQHEFIDSSSGKACHYLQVFRSKLTCGVGARKTDVLDRGKKYLVLGKVKVFTLVFARPGSESGSETFIDAYSNTRHAI